MAEDERRVCPRPMVVTGGTTATPEGIADLERRRATVERLHRAKSSGTFGAILAGKAKETGGTNDTGDASDQTDERLKKGLRPGLVHPSQRQTYGREDDQDTVILKG